MSNSQSGPTFKDSVLKKITIYSGKVSAMGRQVRQRVFGFGRRSTARSDRWSLPVKVLHDHRLVQRRRAFRQAGGSRSSIALHALNKARHNKQQP
ncbi:MAG: hypothetical protein FOGNACKC_03086 [Anaerolineae bacterium]|nr:hypothetical protein [Anaerolineae bacterium]